MATQRIIDSAGTWPNEHSAGRRSESQAFILRALFQRQVERRWSCRVSQEERASRWPETSWILPPITAWDDSGRHHPLHRLADAFLGDGEKEKDGLVGWHSSAGLGTCICLGTAGNAVQRAQASRLTFHHPTPPIHHDSQLSTQTLSDAIRILIRGPKGRVRQLPQTGMPSPLSTCGGSPFLQPNALLAAT